MSKVDLSGKKLMISTPAYDGKVPVEWMLAFNYTVFLCQKYGIELGITVRMNSSLIPKCRDEIVHNFLFQTDFDYLLCIDADVVWKPEDVLHMLAKIDKFGTIAGVYCVKDDKEDFKVSLMTIDKKPIEADGLLRAKAVPAGFLMLDRKTLMGLREKYEYLYYKTDAEDVDKEHEVCAMFSMIVGNGNYVGEDIAFCMRLVESGYRLWVDPEIELVHIGAKKYDHSYKEYLLNFMEDEKEVVVQEAPSTIELTS